jgi:methylaspartate ammonia-lyase
MTRFFRALEAKYQAKIEEALATLELYFNKSVGVGEHPDIIDVLEKYLDMLDENKSKLQTIRELFCSSENQTNNQ